MASFQIYKEYLPDVPLYLTLGNHEGYPVNAFPTEDIIGEEFNGDWLYGGIGDLIEDWIGQDAAGGLILAAIRVQGFNYQRNF